MSFSDSPAGPPALTAVRQVLILQRGLVVSSQLQLAFSVTSSSVPGSQARPTRELTAFWASLRSFCGKPVASWTHSVFCQAHPTIHLPPPFSTHTRALPHLPIWLAVNVDSTLPPPSSPPLYYPFFPLFQSFNKLPQTQIDFLLSEGGTDSDLFHYHRLIIPIEMSFSS